MLRDCLLLKYIWGEVQIIWMRPVSDQRAHQNICGERNKNHTKALTITKPWMLKCSRHSLPESRRFSGLALCVCDKPYTLARPGFECSLCGMILIVKTCPCVCGHVHAKSSKW